MPILRGPIRIDEVTNFIESISKMFHASSYGCNGCTPQAGIMFWTPQMIDEYNDSMRFVRSADKAIPILYKAIIDGKAIEKLKAFAGNVFSTVHILNAGWNYDFGSHIANKTLLEDIASGQTFPSPISEFVIVSYGSHARAFAEYRDQMMAQAQERLNQAVSITAQRIMTDLH